MIVTLHQPNFFHFAGVLDKIRRADIFISLNHAQFSRGNYHNRFQLGGRWYTMSVEQSLVPLSEKQYIACFSDWDAIKRKLPAYASILEDFDDCIGPDLVDTNTAILKRVCERLGIKTILAQDVPLVLGKSERLLKLCQMYNATKYLSGPSGRNYLDVKLFEEAGIEVEFQEPGDTRAAIELLARDKLGAAMKRSAG